MSEQVDLVAAVGEATKASAAKEAEMAKAIRVYRRAFMPLVLAIIILVTGVVVLVYEVHQFNARADRNAEVLVCAATASRVLAADFHQAFVSQDRNPADYPIPPTCKKPS